MIEKNFSFLCPFELDNLFFITQETTWGIWFYLKEMNWDRFRFAFKLKSFSLSLLQIRFFWKKFLKVFTRNFLIIKVLNSSNLSLFRFRVGNILFRTNFGNWQKIYSATIVNILRVLYQHYLLFLCHLRYTMRQFFMEFSSALFSILNGYCYSIKFIC